VDVQDGDSCCRDRLGEKPLYYGGVTTIFSSVGAEGFPPHPGFIPEVDRALTLYLRHGYVPSPHCILSGFHKLLPGHILSLPLDGSAGSGSEALRLTGPSPTRRKASFSGSPRIV